jgi:phosphate/sulfate permease
MPKEKATWEKLSMVYGMLGFLFTLGGGAFFSFSMVMEAIGQSWTPYYYTEGAAMITSILVICLGAVLFGLALSCCRRE